jgi:PEP-CTERM motif
MKNRIAAVATAIGLISSTPLAQAFFSVSNLGSSIVSNVTLTGPDEWTYSYALTNTATCFGNCSDTSAGKPIDTYLLSIREFSLPFFADYGGFTLETITSPADWSWSVENSPFVKDDGSTIHGSQTLLWTAQTDTAGIALNGNKGGFGFIATFSAGYAPYSVSYPTLGTFHGDPPIPLSPLAIAAGIQPVPEPHSALLLALGLGALALRHSQRR